MIEINMFRALKFTVIIYYGRSFKLKKKKFSQRKTFVSTSLENFCINFIIHKYVINLFKKKHQYDYVKLSQGKITLIINLDKKVNVFKLHNSFFLLSYYNKVDAKRESVMCKSDKCNFGIFKSKLESFLINNAN